MAIFRNITSKKKNNAFENPNNYCTSKFPLKKKRQLLSPILLLLFTLTVK